MSKYKINIRKCVVWVSDFTRLFVRVISNNRLQMLSVLLLPFLGVWMGGQIDSSLLARIQSLYPGNKALPEWISLYGQFQFSTLGLSLLLYMWFRSTRDQRLWRAFQSCLIAGMIAGVLVTVLRPAFGRARPYASVEPGFYVMEMHHPFHSFPSGHVTTTTASAVAVAICYPPSIPVAVLTSGVMAWSRMELNKHYPSDVFAGWILGIGCAVFSVKTLNLQSRNRDRKTKLRDELKDPEKPCAVSIGKVPKSPIAR